ncbi:uncharacterized protein METZ01_LOCUS257032, partial [marine metagenome]
MSSRLCIFGLAVLAQILAAVTLNGQAVDSEKAGEYEWDIMIRGGTVVDGTGERRVVA